MPAKSALQPRCCALLVQGRILVLAVRDGRLQLVAEKEVKGAAYNVNPFQARALLAVCVWALTAVLLSSADWTAEPAPPRGVRAFAAGCWNVDNSHEPARLCGCAGPCVWVSTAGWNRDLGTIKPARLCGVLCRGS
jgi:hypothetical protein